MNTKTDPDQVGDPVSARAIDDFSIVGYMKDATRLAGASLAYKFSQVSSLSVMSKGPSDFVTAADMDSERILIRSLRDAVPGIAVLGEETGASGDDSDVRIVMDPLDGTNNFIHGIPHFSVSLALMRGNEVTAGVVFNPLNEDMFWAVRGHGAYHGQRRLAGSERDALSKAVVGTCFPYNGKGDVEKCATEMLRVMPLVSGIRSLGSAALQISYVAEGRFDAFWTSGAKLDIWDLAAGVIIAREAGCLVSEIDGSGDPLLCRSLLVTAAQFQDPLIDALVGRKQ
jgi:myo-inositol-1(or 4)-monophosphatase